MRSNCHRLRKTSLNHPHAILNYAVTVHHTENYQQFYIRSITNIKCSRIRL
jgi:hypothetical protein